MSTLVAPLLALLAAAPSPEAVVPVDAIILGGSRDSRARFEGVGWIGLSAKTGLLQAPGFPLEVDSAKVSGLKPGFQVTILGFCPPAESERVLAAARLAFPGAYVRKVTGQQPACPRLAEPRAQALVNAAGEGDLKAVRELLAAGVPTDASGSYLGKEATALAAAVSADKTDVARLLLERGADLQVASRFLDGGVLGRAVSHGNEKLVELLLAHKADPNGRTPYGGPHLRSALEGAKIGISERLLRAGANPRATYALSASRRADDLPEDEAPSFFAAACRGGSELPRMLAAHGVDLKEKSKQGATILVYAVTDCNATRLAGETSTAPQSAARLERVKALLDFGVDPNARPSWGMTALHEAMAAGNQELVEPLLAHGAEVKSTDAMGRTALFHAACEGLGDAVGRLLKAGAPADLAAQGVTPLACVVANRDSNDVEDIVDLLLAAKADPKVMPGGGYVSIADRACASGHLNVALKLVKRGASFMKGKPTERMCVLTEGD
jgi:ankyrin repeat protein